MWTACNLIPLEQLSVLSVPEHLIIMSTPATAQSRALSCLTEELQQCAALLGLHLHEVGEEPAFPLPQPARENAPIRAQKCSGPVLL